MPDDPTEPQPGTKLYRALQYQREGRKVLKQDQPYLDRYLAGKAEPKQSGTGRKVEISKEGVVRRSKQPRRIDVDVWHADVERPDDQPFRFEVVDRGVHPRNGWHEHRIMSNSIRAVNTFLRTLPPLPLVFITAYGEASKEIVCTLDDKNTSATRKILSSGGKGHLTIMGKASPRKILSPAGQIELKAGYAWFDEDSVEHIAVWTKP